MRRYVTGAAATLILGATAVLSAGCSRYYDAWVINPCPQPVRVETHEFAVDETPRYAADRSVTIAAHSERKIEDAYYDPDHDVWTVRVVGIADRLPPDPDDWDGDTLALPREVCVSAYTPPVPMP